ncbi:ABC transporter permease [Paenibacillus spongiae]|uniref:ABC transporter permease subunit n=1 Tax=Paenibacillus spongiae TaxID=2909671 RepID=A0ABY5SBL4_9BACL|nr:ABC transporter permease subunit [Paenibacillus spongiae]UVI31331.1 ABC transporter permease subunit [Paenibacillus spongiae]
MTQWFVLYRKEWRELVRSYKLIWVPIVFILLGASQPVTTYFLPDILASAGNLPEGATFEFPVPRAVEVLAQTLSQFGTLGLLVVALSCMGTISGERVSGTASMILVKPVSYTAFVTSKWAAMLTLSTLSFAMGYGASWYYTMALFEAVGWQEVVGSLLLFALWLGFVGTVTIMFSSLLRSPAAAAFSALASAMLLSVTASLLPRAFAWSPGNLSKLASEQVLNGSVEGAWLPVIITLCCMAAALLASAGVLRKRPSLDAV